MRSRYVLTVGLLSLAVLVSASNGSAQDDQAAALLGSSGTDQVYTPITPCRFVDGVTALDRVVAAANSTTARYYRVRGNTSSDFVSQGVASGALNGCGVPTTATAVMVNFTVADPDADGDLRADPAHVSTPTPTSTLNYTFGGVRGKNLANGVVVSLCDLAVSTCSSGGTPASPTRDILVTFHAGATATGTYLLADVLGYFAPAAGFVSSVNSIAGPVTLAAGANVTVTPSGNTLTIAASAQAGVTSVSASAPLASSGGTTPNLSLTGTVAVANGGTGAANASAARTNLGAAARGANSDITSLSALTTPLSAAQGGTGQAALTLNGVLYGQGAGAVGNAVGVAGQVLAGTAGPPVWTGSPSLSGTLTLPAASTPAAGNVFKGANRFLHNFGTANTFVGENSGNFTTTGANNTGIGNAALQNNSIGIRNTAVGAGALQSNTFGDSSTATGYQALFANSGGFANTAHGAFSLQSNSGGNGNTAAGYFALQGNTSGSFNTAIGTSALQANTVAIDNTAAGRNALQNNTGGSRNTAVGSGALGAQSFDNGGLVWLSEKHRRRLRGARRQPARQHRDRDPQQRHRSIGAVAQHDRNEQHGHRLSRALEQHDRRCQHRPRRRRAQEHHHRDVQHGRRRDRAPGQHHGHPKCGGRRGRAPIEHDRQRQHRHRHWRGQRLDDRKQQHRHRQRWCRCRSATIRIGTQGTQARAFVAGIRRRHHRRLTTPSTS
jgi:hypothetical protein